MAKGDIDLVSWYIVSGGRRDTSYIVLNLIDWFCRHLESLLKESNFGSQGWKIVYHITISGTFIRFATTRIKRVYKSKERREIVSHFELGEDLMAGDQQSIRTQLSTLFEQLGARLVKSFLGTLADSDLKEFKAALQSTVLAFSKGEEVIAFTAFSERAYKVAEMASKSSAKTCEYFFYFKHKRSMKKFLDSISDNRLNAFPGDKYDGEWTCRVSDTFSTGPDSRLEERLLEAARIHGGDYDGWSV